MEKKIAVGKAAAMAETLGKLLEQEAPGDVTFRMLSASKALQKDTEAFFETRDKLIKKHGENNSIGPNSKEWPEFVKAMDEMGKVEISVSVELKEEDLMTNKISGQQVMLLDAITK